MAPARNYGAKTGRGKQHTENNAKNRTELVGHRYPIYTYFPFSLQRLTDTSKAVVPKTERAREGWRRDSHFRSRASTL